MSRSARKAETKFRLIIVLTGICLYVWAGDRKSVTLVMPDARKKKREKPPKHPDGTRAVPHAGYLRFDLKNLATAVRYDEPEPEAEDDDEIPSYEVVHRFQREELVLGLPTGEKIGGLLNLPDLSVFAPVRRPDPHLGDERPPATVLMRTRLVGGSFRTATESLAWKIDGDLHEEQKMTPLKIGGVITWERELGGTGLEVILRRFDGKGKVEIPLRALPPRPGATPEIRLKIANLCSNPLEWPELETPPEPVADVDFKWLYKLLKPRSGKDRAAYPEHLCPVPEPVLDGTLEEGDLQDCFGLQVTPR